MINQSHQPDSTFRFSRSSADTTVTNRTISITCPRCSKTLRAPASAAGRKGKCTGCNASIRIPENTDHVTRQPSAPRTESSRKAKPATSSRKQSSAVREQAGHGSQQKPVIPSENAHLDSPIIKKPTSAPKRVVASLVETDSPISSETDLANLDLTNLVPETPTPGNSSSDTTGQSQLDHGSSLGPLTIDDIQSAMPEKLPKRPASFAYRLNLLLVAAAMAALPVIYVLFVVGIGFGVAWYAFQILPTLFQHTPRGRAGGIYIVGVCIPVLIGAILVFFLGKPLFFRIRDERRRRSLTRSAQPLLFAFVDRICEVTGAPVPQRIDIDYAVNASAQPLGGIWSVAQGKMVLTIGAPLIAGLTARQLGGVLAHEFGHFSQKVGMGATVLIQRVNFWFVRVVYQRDTFDELLDGLIEESDWRLAMILLVAKFFVMLSRAVMWCFMAIGQVLSAGLLRQMEYDADRYEYGLVGSKTFAETSMQLRLLNAAQEHAINKMLTYAQTAVLIDDMVYLNQHSMQQMGPKTRKKIRESQNNEQQSLLASHPTDQRRIDRAKASDSDGVFQMDRPAVDLVFHFEAIRKGVTWDFYRDQIGIHLNPNQLVPTTEVLNKTPNP